MINIDSSVFIQIGNFLLLIWLMNKILYKPIRRQLLERKQKIDGLSEDIDTFINDAQQKDEDFSSGIKAARSEGLKEKEKLIQAAEADEKAIIARINEKAQEDLLKMKEQIAKDAEKVRNELLQQVDTFAIQIGQKILGRAV